MNLALLFPDDFIEEGRVRLSGRRRTHLDAVLNAAEGDVIPVGVLDGGIGDGKIVRLSPDEAELDIQIHSEAPTALPLTLVMAMPRPKMFRRILQTATTLGVKDIWLINSWKVEKSFWQTPWLSEAALLENMTLGLEQARDTRLPQVHIRKLFKPFVEDELPALVRDRHALVAHPGTETPCPQNLNEPTLLCVGPEGGFTDYEVGKLADAGCEPVNLGPRILRMETAVPALIARLFDACY